MQRVLALSYVAPTKQNSEILMENVELQELQGSIFTSLVIDGLEP